LLIGGGTDCRIAARSDSPPATNSREGTANVTLLRFGDASMSTVAVELVNVVVVGASGAEAAAAATTGVAADSNAPDGGELGSLSSKPLCSPLDDVADELRERSLPRPLDDGSLCDGV
jgi:hypothetical protein